MDVDVERPWMAFPRLVVHLATFKANRANNKCRLALSKYVPRKGFLIETLSLVTSINQSVELTNASFPLTLHHPYNLYLRCHKRK